MRILLDTNVILRMAQPTHPQHKEAADAVRVLISQLHELVFVPQNIYEFWVVATRPPTSNGLGYTPSQADAEISQLAGPFTLLLELPAAFAEWRRIVVAHTVVGKNAHDAHLVATMIVHGVLHLLTFNDQDFRRFTGISVMTPAMVLASQSTATP